MTNITREENRDRERDGENMTDSQAWLSPCCRKVACLPPERQRKTSSRLWVSLSLSEAAGALGEGPPSLLL